MPGHSAEWFDVVVVGGGVAGSAAAIALAERGRRVLVVEKQRYPAHKVCGEFLSVEVEAALARLGVGAAIRAAGAHPITQTLVTAGDGAAFRASLPGTALGLSRYTLDTLLAARARDAGAVVREGVAVRGVTGDLDRGFVVETDAGSFGARVVFGAYGKRSALDRRLARPFLGAKSPFVAFKAHYDGLEIPGTVELHAFEGGYCGLSHVEDGRVNACWIARATALQAAGGRPEDMVERTFAQHPFLARRFAAMHRLTDRFYAVGPVAFTRKGVFDGDVCMIGDAAGMIAPLCGDGMAMALHGAALAVPPAVAFLEGRGTADGFRAAYGRAWHAAFAGRMRLGRWIHYGYVHPVAAGIGLRVLHRLPALGRWVIRQTRGTVVSG